MAASLIQTQKQSSGAYTNSFTVTLASSVAAGNFLVMVLVCGNADTISSITDNRGNTWSLAVTQTGTYTRTSIYYAKNTNAGSTTITITYTAGQYPDSAVIVREFSGIDTASPLDRTASATNGGFTQSHSSGTTATTTQANELIIGGCGVTNSTPTWGVSAGYGNLTSQAGFNIYTGAAMADRSVTATGAQSVTFTTTTYDGSTTAIATFKEAAAPAGGRVKVWNGSAWVAKPVKVWNGSSWVTKPVKHWNGTAWEESS